MRLIAVICLAFFCFSAAHAKEYGDYDVERILIERDTPSGKNHSIDVTYLDQIIDDLDTHANNYPPVFDSPQDHQRASKDAHMLSEVLDIPTSGANPHPGLILRAAILNSLAHNLDIKGAAERANQLFQKLLTDDPSNPMGNHRYGVFLSGVGKTKEAIPYLEKALASGAIGVNYSLGVSYLILGNKQRAIEYLEAFQRERPNDTSVVKLLEAIRRGKIEYKWVP